MAPRVGLIRAPRELPATLVVWLGLVGYVVLVYVLVVLGGGLLIGQTDAPNLVLSVVATAVVALGFGPVQTRLERVALRSAGGGGSPYEVLRHFSERVTAGYDSEDIPVQMAKLLAEGTGARWAQVWLVIAGRPSLAASWPPAEISDRQPPEVTGTFSELPGSPLRSLPVRHGGSVLAVLRVHENDRQPLTPVAAGDYATGGNHVLPTGGWARSTGGLGLETFLKPVTTQRLTREGLERIRPTVEALAAAEGMPAHIAAVQR